MTPTPDERLDRLRNLIIGLAVTVALTLTSVISTAYLTYKSQLADDARRAEACHIVTDALDKFTDQLKESALANATSASDKLAIEVQTRLFKAAIHDKMENCAG